MSIEAPFLIKREIELCRQIWSVTDSRPWSREDRLGSREVDPGHREVRWWGTLRGTDPGVYVFDLQRPQEARGPECFMTGLRKTNRERLKAGGEGGDRG